ncbi:hypothetical protein [Sciscionella sediminilitoris]|uniref:hypothetical protein n=1 Tax=Sciscionella sediminilitoris TaxID=1445613 RepID=UPI0004DF3361|nr:hypothetical protein [Sciscionella sp. SE31]
MDTDATRAHTLFALGRGAHAQPLGTFGGFLAPDDVARFPIGRQLLASTAPNEVRDRFARFALAWDVAGFDTFTRASGKDAIPEATVHRADWVPHESCCDIYAFDDGQWFHWIATDYPQWLLLTLAENGTVTEHPVSLASTAPTMPGLKGWIWPSLRPGSWAPPRRGWTARMWPSPVHHAQPDELGVISAELESIAQSCNWSNPYDAEDWRFDWCAPASTLPTECKQAT